MQLILRPAVSKIDRQRQKTIADRLAHLSDKTCLAC